MDNDIITLTRSYIELTRSYIDKEDNLERQSSDLILSIGKAIDRAAIHNTPTTPLEHLYSDALWLNFKIHE